MALHVKTYSKVYPCEVAGYFIQDHSLIVGVLILHFASRQFLSYLKLCKTNPKPTVLTESKDV